MPFSQTSQPSPQAPSVGFSQSSSDEAHIVGLQVEAERFERAEVEIEDVGGRGLQHDLVLVVVLKPVRVVAVAAVLRSPARLHVGRLPGLGPIARKKVAVWLVPAPTSMS